MTVPHRGYVEVPIRSRLPNFKQFWYIVFRELSDPHFLLEGMEQQIWTPEYASHSMDRKDLLR